MTKSAPPNPTPETSSLFSLSSLQEMAGPTTAVPSKPPTAEEEGSGMLDILAIAESSRQSGQVMPRPAPLPTTLLAGPVTRAGSGDEGMSGRTKLAMAVMAVAILLLGGATAFLALRPAATASVVPGEASVAPPPVAALPAPQAPQAAPQVPEEPAQAVQAPQPKEPEPALAAPRPEKRREVEAKAVEPVAAEPKGTGDKSMDNLLEQALGGGGKKPRSTSAGSASTSDAPAAPSREDVLSAMVAVTPKVKACGKGQGGLAMAKITVAGNTGRVLNVTVDGITDSTVKACVVHEASRAKLPPFTNPSFSVTYPFKL